MINSCSRAIGTLSAVLLYAPSIIAQSKSAYELLPQSTQAVVWVANSDELVDGWRATQLYALTSDPAVAPFFEEQKQELEKRLVDAGWRLNVKPEDLRNVSRGQVGLAWIEMANPRKPFGLAMIADVADDPKTNQKLLAKIEGELLARGATQTQLTHQGTSVTKYTLPRRAGELLAETSYYAITDGYFLATDEQKSIEDVISRIQRAEVAGGVLADEPVFIEGREQLELSEQAQLEYFVRPLGFARILRAIGGKKSKSNTDILAVLSNQGFDSIKCVCGELSLGQTDFDIRHRGYVLIDRPLPKSAALLDFPNNVKQEVPSFVSESISSLLATHWNAKEAFWKSEGLVDELAGTPGVFDEVIEGIKMDPNGPRIDIERDVLPHFTNDIYAISDTKTGEAEVDSRRNLIALRLNNSEAMAKVLDRAMRNEPDAELVDYEGQPIWKVVHREDEEIIDLAADFGSDFGAPPAAQGNQPQPWLSNWAITVYDDFLMFASHVEMIQEAIVQSKAPGGAPLKAAAEYQRVMQAIDKQFGDEPRSAWQIVHTARAYRVQYELFRQGKLRQSQSMLATLLDRLLQTDSEMDSREQKVSGEKLPPFEAVSHFLQPSGLLFRTTDHGWEFGSLMLSPAKEQAGEEARAAQLTEEELNPTATQEAARVSLDDELPL